MGSNEWTVPKLDGSRPVGVETDSRRNRDSDRAPVRWQSGEETNDSTRGTFMRPPVGLLHMSTATKVVLVTVGVSALLALALIANVALA